MQGGTNGSKEESSKEESSKEENSKEENSKEEKKINRNRFLLLIRPHGCAALLSTA